MDYFDLCAVGLWATAAGDSATSAWAATILAREPTEGPTGPFSIPAACHQMLRTDEAVRNQRRDAAAELAALEEMSLQQPTGVVWIDASMNLLLARLHESQGDDDRALAALRRRPMHYGRGIVFLATYLREEGRLAAKMGLVDEAIDAYQHYLHLRADPAPAYAAEASAVRRELAQLIESGR